MVRSSIYTNGVNILVCLNIYSKSFITSLFACLACQPSVILVSMAPTAMVIHAKMERTAVIVQSTHIVSVHLVV